MSIAVVIALAVAAGLFIVLTLKLTFSTLFEKIKEKLALDSNEKIGNIINKAADHVKTAFGKVKGLFSKEKKTNKAVVADIERMMVNCTNQSSTKEMGELLKQGKSHIIAGIDDNDNIIDMEVIEDELNGSDKQVSDFINKTGEGMVVISA